MPSPIIFDADGTLTPLRGSATAPFTFELLPGVAEKCAELRATGHTLAIASNQSRRRPRTETDRQAAEAAGCSFEWANNFFIGE